MSEIVQKLAKLASEVVNEYTRGVHLNDGICKVAARENLNSNEVQRLVESCNTLTWLSTVKPSMDKTAEFPVASYPEVVRKLHPKREAGYDVCGASYVVHEDPLTKVAEEVFTPKSYDYDGLAPMEKVASVHYMSKAAAAHSNMHHRSKYDLKCLLEETKEALACTLEKLAGEFAKVYCEESFSDFEKRAYSFFGTTQIKPLLDLVCHTSYLEKVARVDPLTCTSMPVYHEDKKLELLKEASEYLKGMVNIRKRLLEKTSEFSRKSKAYAGILCGGEHGG